MIQCPVGSLESVSLPIAATSAVSKKLLPELNFVICFKLSTGIQMRL
jgi:hypothetical protein